VSRVWSISLTAKKALALLLRILVSKSSSIEATVNAAIRKRKWNISIMVICIVQAVKGPKAVNVTEINGEPVINDVAVAKPIKSISVNGTLTSSKEAVPSEVIKKDPPKSTKKQRNSGYVNFFNYEEGFGHITMVSGEQILFHRDNFKCKKGKKKLIKLKEGHTLEFDVVQEENGPRAMALTEIGGGKLKDDGTADEVAFTLEPRTTNHSVDDSFTNSPVTKKEAKETKEILSRAETSTTAMLFKTCPGLEEGVLDKFKNHKLNSLD